MQKNNSLNSKRILKPNYKLSEGPVFKYNLPGVAVRPSSLSSVTPLVNPVCITQRAYLLCSTAIRRDFRVVWCFFSCEQWRI